MESLRKQCEEVQDYVVKTRRKLHQIPELGINIPKTTEFICNELDKMGIPYKVNTAELNGIKDTGIVGFIEGKNTDKVIALRADMDALPVKELTDLPYKSLTDGKMHACGHDNHMAMLLGAAKVLNDNREKLNGSVKLFFQTGEEIITGAKMLIEGGCMENPKVTACFGMHVWPLDPAVYKPGEAVFVSGPMMASGNRFIIRIKGVGCHGSLPHLGKDPIVAGAHIITMLQDIASREFSGEEPRVLSVCQFHAGSFWNVIPDDVWMEGTIRTMNPDTRSHYIRRVEEIVKNASAALRCEGTVEWPDGTPVVINNPDITAIVENAARKVLGDEFVSTDFKPSMGNEDFAYYQEIVPGAFIFLNTSNAEKDTFIPLHSPIFKVDEDILWHGTALHVQTAADYLS
ncbi:M20 family metallopeptidase [Lachnospiraceae bacterium NSJ-143]|nr:M20 family metallopeptidase [Lachnospiraceae bacterium NSJ-143]